MNWCQIRWSDQKFLRLDQIQNSLLNISYGEEGKPKTDENSCTKCCLWEDTRNLKGAVSLAGTGVLRIPSGRDSGHGKAVFEVTGEVNV